MTRRGGGRLGSERRHSEIGRRGGFGYSDRLGEQVGTPSMVRRLSFPVGSGRRVVAAAVGGGQVKELVLSELLVLLEVLAAAAVEACAAAGAVTAVAVMMLLAVEFPAFRRRRFH